MALFARYHDENTRTTYGYSFQTTKDHYTPEQMDAMRFSYDKLAEDALQNLDEICPIDVTAAARNLSRAAGGAIKGDKQAAERDTYALLAEHHTQHPTLGALWKQINEVPAWVDWKQIERGQEVLWRYAAPAMVGFAFQGLLGGTGSSRRPAETLVRTGGHSVKVARHRFFETFQHLLQSTSSLASVQPGGAGFKATVRVRLLHAAVRARILAMARSRPGYYDTATYGVPISDLDAVQALCTFSTNVLFLGLPRQGIWPRAQEVEDYVALWRWVGYLIGAPTEQMVNPTKAKAAMESLLLEAVRPSESSRILAHNVVKCLTDMPPSYAGKGYWEVGTRWINGNQLADDMGLGRPGLYYWVAFLGQCWLFSGICYITREIPALDRKMIALTRKVFWDYVVEGKDGLREETKFDMKYLPSYETRTGRESEAFAYVPRPGMETLGMIGFVIGCIFSLLTIFTTYCLASFTINNLPWERLSL